MDMRFRAIVKDGKILADIEAGSCEVAASEFLGRLSEYIKGGVSVEEKKGSRQGVMA